MIILRDKNFATTIKVSDKEYEHIRAEMEKQPSIEAAKVQKDYEVNETSIIKNRRDNLLSGESKDKINPEVRQEKENNLNNRESQIKLVNEWLSKEGICEENISDNENNSYDELVQKGLKK